MNSTPIPGSHVQLYFLGGKYEYCRLPMGPCNSPDTFQEQINNIFHGMEHVRVYIDDISCLTKGDWDDHLAQLEQVLSKLHRAGLKVNIEKLFFGRTEARIPGILDS